MSRFIMSLLVGLVIFGAAAWQGFQFAVLLGLTLTTSFSLVGSDHW